MFPSNFIKKGRYDNKVYKKDESIDPNYDNQLNSNLFKDFKDSFSLQQNVNLDRGITPELIPYSRQVHSTVKPNSYFELGEPYDQVKGSNFNGYKPIMPFNSLDLLTDGVNDLFKTIDKETIDNSNIVISKTHNNELDMEKESNTDNNLGFPVKKLADYDKTYDFLEKNIRGTKEIISEYVIYINSSDRNYEAYPNPFDYRVDFNGAPSSKNENGVPNPTNANIAKYLKNIKFINLKTVILPRRYYIINKHIDLIYNVSNVNVSDFVNQFKNTQINSSVCLYNKYLGTIINSNFTYYFYYYDTIILSNHYYICSYDLFLDKHYRQKIDIQIDPPNTNADIINDWLNAGTSPVGFDISSNIIEQNSWILIDKTDNRIKFCRQDDRFNEIIDQTFQFSYNKSNNTITNDSFYMYILLNQSTEDDRLILLNIDEIETNYDYATDQNIERAFSILFPDYINGDYYYLNTTYHEKIYNTGTLGNIPKMTIQFKNSYGSFMKSFYNKNIIDYDIKTPKNECICTYDKYTGNKVRNYQCYHSYLRHGTFEKLQNTLLFKVGIIEGTQDIINL
jgi:hypothetical protein